nr:hypothetical protein [Nocardioidaceae bacterium]
WFQSCCTSSARPIAQAYATGHSPRWSRAVTWFAVHWRHAFAEAATDGDQAHVELAAASDLRPVVHHVESDFRLDVWRRR